MAERCDVLVVGAGPAGLAAAAAAARQGANVGLLDAQAYPGGQVWRHDVAHAAPRPARRAVDAAVTNPRVRWLAGAQVVAAEGDGVLVETPDSARWIRYGALVMATGARELLLPFPGWTRPGVTGAGGLQALVKQGWPIAGKRVVVAGSGPLLLAAAASLRAHGAHVLGIFEQAPRSAVMRFARGLWRWPARLVQAARLRTQLAGVPYRCGSIVVRALGDDALREIEVEGPAGNLRIACDALAVGYGLVPNLELARLLGCALDTHGVHAHVRVDARQQTSVANVYAAGEACGIGGRDAALVEGEIAGLAGAGATAAALAPLLHRRQRARAFAAHLQRYFVLSSRVHALAQADTLVCRCEDVPLGALEGFRDGRAAKLATRCGMGACQGRICGAALAELGRFQPIGQRPPLFPARVGTLSEPNDSVPGVAA